MSLMALKVAGHMSTWPPAAASETTFGSREGGGAEAGIGQTGLQVAVVSRMADRWADNNSNYTGGN